MRFRLISLLIVLFLPSFSPPGPETGKSIALSDAYYYRVIFKDKGDVSISDFSPENLLSPAALARRQKCGAEPLSYSDLPVNIEYINSVSDLGLLFICTSKWMNSALFSSPAEFNISGITDLQFVKRVVTVKVPPGKGSRIIDKRPATEVPVDAGVIKPVSGVNGMPLYLSGFRGKGVTVAVIDAGFINADKIESLSRLYARKGIIATYDFVTRNTSVYGHSTHGTDVLSIMAGDIPGVIIGTACDANYILLRTEDDETEYPVEEDYWAAAAEYADSAGADIITSSLGYYDFDDPDMDYSFSDADGNTAFITVAADMAASKGILVVSSAGNERDNEWKRISFPSDGDSVLCVGAVSANGIITYFSSAGYSADGQVKPDVVAQGLKVPIQYLPGVWHYGDGTSFSCPVISGMCASLMQAVPDATATEISDAIRKSADRYNNPDSLYGYGRPDFTKALGYLYETYAYEPDSQITAGPNPFTDEITLWFRESPGSLSVLISDNSGRTIIRKHFGIFIGRSYSITGLSGLSRGLYMVKVTTDKGESHYKMVRQNR